MAGRLTGVMLAVMEPPDDLPAGLCVLQYAASRVEDCLGARCPFWVIEPGEGRCAFAGVEGEIAMWPTLVHHLLELRLALDRAAHPEREQRGRSLFFRL
jgi:hypothetical protein